MVDFEAGWETTICAASGPSLNDTQAELIVAARANNECRILVVNDTWQKFPNADALYAADGPWWTMHFAAVEHAFRGELWTQDLRSSQQYGLNYVKAKALPGLSRDPDLIHMGGNGGYQAINLAYHFGAQKIILVGYDMQRTNGKAHWFGDHPKPLRQPDKPQEWVPRFTSLAADLREEGIEVINCSVATALTQFERMPLCDALR